MNNEVGGEILFGKQTKFKYIDLSRKNDNSLETQFWSDNVEVDTNSPMIKLIDKVWNLKEDYIPTEEEIKQFNKEMENYHKNKNNTKNEEFLIMLSCR